MPPKKDRIIGDAQPSVTDLINQSQTRLEAINADIKKAEENRAFLQLETESIQKNLNFLNGNLEKRKQDTADFEENYKLRLIDLDDVKVQISNKKAEMAQFEKDSTDQIKRQVASLESDINKLEKLKVDLNDEIVKLNSNISKLNESSEILKTSINSLKTQENDLKGAVNSETSNIQELTKDVDKFKEQIESYTNVLEVLKQDIKDNQAKNSELINGRVKLEKDLVEANKKVEEANAEFDKMSKKSQILIDRTEFQDGQEIYLKEQFDKIGRVYQPYAQ